MPRRKKKRSVEGKHPIELTDDETLEKLFGKEVRDKLKDIAVKARKLDTCGKESPHK